MSAVAPARESTPVRSAQRPTRVGDALLTAAAVGGALCLVLVVLAWAGGISLILFRTGSMSPTIPTGSLAVVQEVDAVDVAVGDVITVERAGRLPVTHRVVGVAGPGPVTLTLQGDANPAPDAETYDVETVERVLWSVPQLGYVVGRLQHPFVVRGATLAVAGLVTWALWPRRGPGNRAEAVSR